MIRQVVQYGLVSFLANSSGLGATWVTLTVGRPIEAGMFMGSVIATLIAHHFNRNWTFCDSGNYLASLGRYYLSNLVLLAIQVGVASILVRGYGFPSFPTACAVLAVMGVLGYAVTRWFAFWRREE